jgi:hypothetical protein
MDIKRIAEISIGVIIGLSIWDSRDSLAEKSPIILLIVALVAGGLLVAIYMGYKIIEIYQRILLSIKTTLLINKLCNKKLLKPSLKFAVKQGILNNPLDRLYEGLNKDYSDYLKNPDLKNKENLSASIEYIVQEFKTQWRS